MIYLVDLSRFLWNESIKCFKAKVEVWDDLMRVICM